MNYIRRLLLFCLVILALVVTSLPVSAAPLAATNSTLTQCLRYSGHIYEVCTAYIFNSSIGALEPYYKYGRSSNSYAVQLVINHLTKRYVGTALTTVTNRVNQFPSGTYTVEGPHITILAATSSLTTDSAVLQTRESWTIRAANGAVVYSENNQLHTVIMNRVPSYILHKWVVSKL